MGNAEYMGTHPVFESDFDCLTDTDSDMSLKIARSSVVCVEAELLGDIEIGERSVIHPKARIIAEKGSIVIGNDNLIEETAVIKNVNEETLYIGNENIFEVQSQFAPNAATGIFLKSDPVSSAI